MTVSSSTNKFRYEGNGSTDTFAITGRIFATGDYTVQLLTRATDAVVETLTETTHYTITINGPESASVVVEAAKTPSATQDILIFRDLDQTQTVDLPTGTRFPAVSVENALDKTTALVQDLSETLTRVVLLPINSSATVPGIGSLTTNEVVLYDGADFITNGITATNIQNAESNATAAASSASAASSSATLASQWATLTGAQVAATDYSAKEYAIGTTVPAGSAKDWAVTPEDTLVDGSGYSALHWAAKAEAFADSVNLPALGAADTVLQVNAGGTALEYGKIATANIADDAVGLAQMAGGTDGNLITYDANGDPAYVATGTSGQVLTSNGAGAAPTFEDIDASGRLIDVQVFTSNGTWTKPSGCNQAKVIVVGGGGGGGGASTNNAAGGGGGAGGTAIKFITSGLGSTETVTIGAAGTAGGSGGTAGGSGGSSSFGAHCSATGGGGGDPSGSTASGGAGGAGSSGDINLNGGGGGGGSDTAGSPSGIGGASYFGGGGAGDLNESAGQAGQAYGSGGAGGRRFSTSQAGGAGKAGIIIVESYT